MRYLALAAALIATGCGSGHADSAAKSSVPPCTAKQLRVALIKNDRFDLALVRFRNASATACKLTGYPSVRLLGSRHRRLPTHLIRASSPDVATVVLEPSGGWAVARLTSP